MTCVQILSRLRPCCQNPPSRPVKRRPRTLWNTWWLCVEPRKLMKTQVVLSSRLTPMLLIKSGLCFWNPSVCLHRTWEAKWKTHWPISKSWRTMTLGWQSEIHSPNGLAPYIGKSLRQPSPHVKTHYKWFNSPRIKASKTLWWTLNKPWAKCPNLFVPIQSPKLRCIVSSRPNL